MNKKLGWVAGALALGAAAVGVAGQAAAQEYYSPLMGPSASNYWNGGTVVGYIQSSTRSVSLYTRVAAPHNYHHTQTNTLCSNQVVYQVNQHVDPLENNLRRRIEFICPFFGNYLSGHGRLIDY